MIKKCYNNIRFALRKKIVISDEIKMISKKTDISVIASDCLGGIKLHDLGMRFNSPTVNLWFTSEDFVKLCNNLHFYLSQDLHFIKDKEEDYPVAYLGDIKVFFTHYDTEEEAERKWNERLSRVNYSSLFFIMTESNGCTELMMREFSNLKHPHVIFTHHEYADIDCAIMLPTRRNMFHDYISQFSIKKFYDKFDWIAFFLEGIVRLK